MKKKILVAGIVMVLLAMSYFVGDVPLTEKGTVRKTVSVEDATMQVETPGPILPEEGKEEPIKQSEESVGIPKEKTTETVPSMGDDNEVSQEESVPISVQAPSPEFQPEEKPERKSEGSAAPEPVLPPQEKEPDLAPEETKTVCRISVRCDEVLSQMDRLKKGKETVIPKDGVFYPETEVEFSEGESVFDVLHRELKARKIPFEFVKTPMYNSVYIEGIGNLYEFDCGDYSGWTYRVNGEKPTVSCSQYPVKPKDVIVFSYTCNYLKDR